MHLEAGERVCLNRECTGVQEGMQRYRPDVHVTDKNPALTEYSPALTGYSPTLTGYSPAG